ncbi:MAG TPA: hypothetical protein PKJ95_07355 [Atribacterota bacterium]|nr:hypothetical protein [Atribacterota bacterium]
MKEEIKQVLDMLREEKISNEDAVNLIDALKSTDSEENEQELFGATKQKKYIRINITKDDKPAVNIKVPFGLIRWGINIANKLGKEAGEIGGKEIPIDLDELSHALVDPDFYGKIIDVYDEEKNEKVIIEIV